MKPTKKKSKPPKDNPLSEALRKNLYEGINAQVAFNPKKASDSEGADIIDLSLDITSLKGITDEQITATLANAKLVVCDHPMLQATIKPYKRNVTVIPYATKRNIRSRKRADRPYQLGILAHDNTWRAAAAYDRLLVEGLVKGQDEDGSLTVFGDPYKTELEIPLDFVSSFNEFLSTIDVLLITGSPIAPISSTPVIAAMAAGNLVLGRSPAVQWLNKPNGVYSINSHDFSMWQSALNSFKPRYVMAQEANMRFASDLNDRALLTVSNIPRILKGV